MAELDFTNVTIVAAVAFAVPLLLGAFPRIRLPAVVLELVAGIVLGPSVLGLVEVDDAVRLLALLGLAWLLFLAGLELDLERLRGHLIRAASLVTVLSFLLALGIGLALDAGGLVSSPLLVAIVLTATGLGIVLPILKDAGALEQPTGRLVIASASVAEVVTIVLLSVFFGASEGGIGSRFLLFGAFVLLLVTVGAAVLAGEHVKRVSAALLRLMDTTAQLRVRGAYLLLILSVLLATQLGLEAILGAFLAGAMLTVVDRDRAMTHSGLRHKLEAVGFGTAVPFFFVASGIRFDLEALLDTPSALALVPVFLGALLVARGLPLLAVRRELGARNTVAAALLQATSIGFIVVGVEIGTELGAISASTGAAFVTAGLVSVLLFPATALALLRRERSAGHEEDPLDGRGDPARDATGCAAGQRAAAGDRDPATAGDRGPATARGGPTATGRRGDAPSRA